MVEGGYNKSSLLTTKTALIATAGVGLICVVLRHRHELLKRIQYGLKFRNPLRRKCIHVVDTVDDCHRIVSDLRRTSTSYKVLGFDCEWVTVGGTRRPIAMLQLSSAEGLCALFRLCNMQQIPKSLRELLEDDEILKVGVGPQEDAKKLANDYGVGVASTFDLRFLAALTNHRCDGLAKLSKSLLNIELDKNWRIACSDWEAKVLNEKQLEYAANDVFIAVEIFKKLINELEPRNFWRFKKPNNEEIRDRLEPFFDVRFKDALQKGFVSVAISKKVATNWRNRKNGPVRSISTRCKALYDNCLLEAPDGELLCTIDRRKAQWYIDQNLGAEVKSDPFTVRLNFEPAGRAVGEVGLYYQMPKENQCVVCGCRDAYIRKNVVPREYRKHFPEIMKSHTSHDVLLLCPKCHQLSNISDLKVRSKLAEKCDAPLTQQEDNKKYLEIPDLKKVKSAARALLLNAKQIPADRFSHLQQIVMTYYANENEMSQELLEEAANMDATVANENYCQHGQKVVEMYQQKFGGLIELEKLWREHFLHTMHPKYLPKLWDVNHNANRLQIRATEGRIDKQDLLLAGLNQCSVSSVNKVEQVTETAK